MLQRLSLNMPGWPARQEQKKDCIYHISEQPPLQNKWQNCCNKHVDNISHNSSPTQLITQNSYHISSHTSTSHRTHLTQLITQNSSHKTQLTQLISHTSSFTLQLIQSTSYISSYLSSYNPAFLTHVATHVGLSGPWILCKCLPEGTSHEITLKPQSGHHFPVYFLCFSHPFFLGQM